MKDGDGLIEVIITTKVAHRIFGFKGPEKLTFKIMLICNHKGKVYTPPNAIETAKRRKKDVETHKGKVIRCVRPT